MDKAKLAELIETEIAQFRVSEMGDWARQYIVPPRREVRKNFLADGYPDHPCWILAEFPEHTLGIAYTEPGFASYYRWCLVRVTDDSYNLDDSFFASLEDAFINTGAWTGRKPDNYEVQ